MAEIELSVLSRQCLNGYIRELRNSWPPETLAWEIERNTIRATVDSAFHNCRCTYQTEETLRRSFIAKRMLRKSYRIKA